MVQVTIRDLLWLMVVAAVIVVWFCDRCAIIASNMRIFQLGEARHADHAALYCCLVVIAVLVFALIQSENK